MAGLLVRIGCVAIALSMLSIVVTMPDDVTAGMSHDPISINGDADFTAANGVTQGDGSESNPFIIEGWTIDASSTTGITVRDTTAYFVIRDVSVKGRWQGSCIVVSNAAHVLVQGATVSDSSWGVRIESCTAALVRDITARGCSEGIALLWCDLCVLIGNNFEYGWVQIHWSTNAMLFSNTFSNGGVSIVGDLWRDETYNSHVIAPNNTVNGHPLLCYSFQDGLTFKNLDAGQLILLSCSNIKISDSTFGREFIGMRLALCENVEITDCTFPDNGFVGCMSCTNVSVSRNTCNGAALGFYQCRNLLVDSNVITNSYYMGIELHNCWKVTASSNTIEGADLYYGIFTTSDDVTLTGNALTKCGIGGSFRAGNNLKISPDNTVNGKPVLYYQNQNDVVVDSVPAGQVIIGSCDRVWIGNISVSQTHTGIVVEDVTDLTIFHTVLTENTQGLSIFDSTDCRALYNQLEGNDYDGATMQYVTGCTVYGNTFKNNENGLRFWMSDDATVFRNIFIGNEVQGSDEGSTNVAWDGGYPEGGNYWSDYSGMDRYSGPDQNLPGSDGFGDTPYSIGTYSQDRYPFMSPPNITIPQPPPPTGVNASIDFEPDTLNVKRMSRWVTVYIELPSGYDVRDIVIDSVVLNGRFPAAWGAIGDFDNDKDMELMVKFDWRNALRLDGVPATMEPITMTVSGNLMDGTTFQGSAEIAIAPSNYQGSTSAYTAEEIGTASFVAAMATILTLLFAVLFIQSRRGST